jgi:hypothetical protein
VNPSEFGCKETVSSEQAAREVCFSAAGKSIIKSGYNLVVVGCSGTGKSSGQAAATQAASSSFSALASVQVE